MVGTARIMILQLTVKTKEKKNTHPQERKNAGNGFTYEFAP